MPLSKEEKKVIVQELIEELKRTPSIVLSTYQGINVKSISELRDSLREKDIKFKIYKNTLLRIAAKEAGLENLTSGLSGSTAVTFSQKESILPIKLLHKFSLDNKEQLKLSIALLEGKIYFGEQLERIVHLPNKEEIIAKMLRSMKIPFNSTVLVLKSQLSGLVNVLDQIKKNKL